MPLVVLIHTAKAVNNGIDVYKEFPDAIVCKTAAEEAFHHRNDYKSTYEYLAE